jgi:hypothetical protein
MLQGKPLSSRRRRALAPAGLLAVLAVLAGPAATQVNAGGNSGGGKGSGGGQTVTTTINLPALVLDNLCNGDVVNLSGDLRITTTTTPRSGGGFTVRSTADARGLRGERIFPLPAIGYRGDDREDTYSYYAPPPQPSTHSYTHWTKLVPEGKAPTMYLVVVIRETILADGTPVPVAERAYLKCTEPKNRKCEPRKRGAR